MSSKHLASTNSEGVRISTDVAKASQQPGPGALSLYQTDGRTFRPFCSLRKSRPAHDYGGRGLNIFVRTTCTTLTENFVRFDEMRKCGANSTKSKSGGEDPMLMRFVKFVINVHKFIQGSINSTRILKVEP